MTFRLEANELISERQNQKLSQYEEKIFMKNLFDKFSIPTTKVTYQCRSGDVTSDTLRKCFSLQKRQNIWVVKASHLTTGNCMYFLHPDGIISLPNPVAPGKHVMAQLQSNNKNQLSLDLMIKDLMDSLQRNA